MTVPDQTAEEPALSQSSDAHLSGIIAPTDDPASRRWPGYAPLTAADASRFCGREDEVAEIVRIIARPKTGQAGMVWIHGGSAVGKTSLIEAGVRPALKEKFGDGFHSIRVTPEQGDDPTALIENVAAQILEASPDEDDMALDLQHRTRQFSLLHGQDSAEAAEYLASCYTRSRPAGVGGSDKVACLVVIDELDRFAPDGDNFLPISEMWQKNHLGPLIQFIHELVLTGVFPCLVGMRSLNTDQVKAALSLSECANLGTWISLDELDLKAVRPFFERAPAELSESDHVNVEPMLLDALIDEVDSSPMGIPFISETLRKLSAIDPDAEELTTADVGWAGGILEKVHRHTRGERGERSEYAVAAEKAVPDELDDHNLGELMLSLHRKVKSGVNKGETVSSTARYLELIQRSKVVQRLVDNLINSRVLYLSGVGVEKAEVQWSIPGALKGWDRAQTWLREEDHRLDTAQRFEKKREEWEKEQRTPVLLVHADRALGDVKHLLAHHQKRPFLSDEVIEYLNESLVIDQRLSGEIRSEQLKARSIKWGGIGLGVLAVLILFLWLIFR